MKAILRMMHQTQQRVILKAQAIQASQCLQSLSKNLKNVTRLQSNNRNSSLSKPNRNLLLEINPHSSKNLIKRSHSQNNQKLKIPQQNNNKSLHHQSHQFKANHLQLRK